VLKNIKNPRNIIVDPDASIVISPKNDVHLVFSDAPVVLLESHTTASFLTLKDLR
jgi:hypothetical protein